MLCEPVIWLFYAALME